MHSTNGAWLHDRLACILCVEAACKKYTFWSHTLCGLLQPSVKRKRVASLLLTLNVKKRIHGL